MQKKFAQLPAKVFVGYLEIEQRKPHTFDAQFVLLYMAMAILCPKPFVMLQIITMKAIKIMNAFIGISQAQTTNLAVVAPGIAEALLATAIGLVAAIPAVVIYNVFSRSITGYRQLVADVTAGIERLVSRDLDYRVAPAGDQR